jgi:hypothetical protein
MITATITPTIIPANGPPFNFFFFLPFLLELDFGLEFEDWKTVEEELTLELEEMMEVRNVGGRDMDCWRLRRSMCCPAAAAISGAEVREVGLAAAAGACAEVVVRKRKRRVRMESMKRIMMALRLNRWLDKTRW